MNRERRIALAATEFAFVLPLLITLLLGCIDLGRFASWYIAVTSAARVGAAVGSTEPFTPACESSWRSAITQAVQEEMTDQSGFDPLDLMILITPRPDDGGEQEVEVEVRYLFRTLIPWPGIPTSLNLRQVVVLRQTRP